MPEYPGIDRQLLHLTPGAADGAFEAQVVPCLIDVWLEHYDRTSPDGDIAEVIQDGFHHLFDAGRERLVAAWGISRGRHGGPRDRYRMAGHPLSAGKRYHRGHAIPHTLGGGTDINLVPQLGTINVGEFRALEILAVATPGALYFTYWMYGDDASQTPSAVEQGLLMPGGSPDIRRFRNA